jgi:hypothetical protein
MTRCFSKNFIRRWSSSRKEIGLHSQGKVKGGDVLAMRGLDAINGYERIP